MKTKENKKTEVKKLEKYKLENFSKLFLQIGLVVSLLVIFVLLENRTEFERSKQKKDHSIAKNIEVDLIDYIEIEEPATNNVKPKKIQKFNKDNIKDVDDDKVIPKFITDEPIVDPKPTVKPGTKINYKPRQPKKKITDEISFIKIEQAPMYPGCEKYEEEPARRKCLQQKVTQHISKHFNSELANELSLDSGQKRIMVQFKIDENGNITNIMASAPHPKLKKEAVRIIGKLPKMTPGMQRERPVIVKYALPINFVVE